MTIEELNRLADTPGLSVSESVHIKLTVALLEEMSLFRKTIESHSASMERIAKGMEYSIEKFFHSVR